MMNLLRTARWVGKESLQSVFDSSKGDIVPRNLGFTDDLGGHGLMTGVELFGLQLGGVEKMHLANALDVDQAE